MRKFSKLLAVLLTLCLLCGIVAMSVTAAEEQTYDEKYLSQLTPTNTLGSDGKSTIVNYLHYPYLKDGAVTMKGTGTSNAKYNKTTAAGTDSNKYWRFYQDQTSGLVTETTPATVIANHQGSLNVGITKYVTFDNDDRGWFLVAPKFEAAETDGVTTYNYTGSEILYDYFVLDFDFGTDRYTMQIGWQVVGKTVRPAEHAYTAEELTALTDSEIQALIDKNATSFAAQCATAGLEAEDYSFTLADARNSVKIAYINDDVDSTSTGIYVQAEGIADNEGEHPTYDGTNYTTTYNSKTNAGVRKNLAPRFYIIYSNGEFYYADNTSVTSSKVMIKASNEVGVYDHFTLVFRVVYNSTTSKHDLCGYWYVNGEFLCSKAESFNYSSLSIGSLRTVIPSENMYSAWSYCFDNYTANYYKAGYTSGDAYGIDDYFTDGDLTTNISKCTDTVYTNGYVNPNEWSATVNGEKYTVPALAQEALVNSIKSGKTNTVDVTASATFTAPASFADGKRSYDILCNTNLVTLVPEDTDAVAVVKTATGYTVYSLDQLKMAFENITEDFDSYTLGSDGYYEFAPAGKGNNALSWMNTGSGTFTNYSYIRAFESSETGNNYLRWSTGDKTSNRTYRADIRYGVYSSQITTLYKAGTSTSYPMIKDNYTDYTVASDYSYVTMDFDIAADQYRYLYNGVEYITSDYSQIPETATEIRLAYPNDVNIYADNRSILDVDTTLTYDEKSGGKSNLVTPTEKYYYDTGSCYAIYISFKYVEGAWHIYTGCKSSSLTDTGYTLSENIGEWNHFTTVLEVIETESTKTSTGTSYGNSKIHLFYNGQLIASAYVVARSRADTAVDISLRGLDVAISNYSTANGTSYPNPKPTDYKYSMAIDNFAVNYYSSGYESPEDVYGVDDICDRAPDISASKLDYNFVGYTTETAPVNCLIADCEDVVYSAYHYVSASTNPSVSVDGKTTYVPAKFEELMASVKNGSTLEINAEIDLPEFELPEGVTSLTVVTDSAFDILNSQKKQGDLLLVVAETDDGYEVREAKEEETVTVEWYASSEADEPLLIEKVPYGYVLDPNRFSALAGLFDESKSKYTYTEYGYANWMIYDLEDGNAYLAEHPAFTAADVEYLYEVAGGLACIEAEGYELLAETVMEDFVIGSYDADGNFIPATDTLGGYTQYNNIANLKTEVEAAPDGATVILMYDSPVLYTDKDGNEVTADKAYDMGEISAGNNGIASNGIYVPVGQTLYFDMNGRTLVASYGARNNYPGFGIFNVTEGATFNLYSSQAGAAIIEANFGRYNYNSGGVVVENFITTDKTDASLRTFGTGGVISVPVGVNKCTVNVGTLKNGGATYDGDNLSYTTGSFFKALGNKVSGGSAIESDPVNRKIEINVDGGEFYSPLRRSYALFAMLAPNVHITLENANVFLTTDSDNGNGIFHDYEDYATLSTVTVRDCTLIAYTKSGSAWNNFDGNESNDTDYSGYSLLWPRMQAGSTCYIENSTVVANIARSTANIDSTANITFGAGVKLSSPSIQSFIDAGKVRFDNDLDATNATTIGKAINASATSSSLDFSIVHNKLTSGAMTDFAVDKDGKLVLNPALYTQTTTTELSLPLNCVTYDTTAELPDELSKVTWTTSEGTTEKVEIVGATPVAPAYTVPEIESGWYQYGYTWGEIAQVGEDDATYTVALTLEKLSRISGQGANMELKLGMTFNLYVPVPAEGSGVSNLVIGGKAASEYEIVTRGDTGVECYLVQWTPSADKFDTKLVEISFTASYEGTTNEVTYETELDPLTYANLVSAAYEAESEQAKLVWAMMAYKEELAKYAAENDNDDATVYEQSEELAKFFTDYAANASTYTDVDSDCDGYDALTSVTGITYHVDTNLAALVIKVSSEVSSIKVSYTGHAGTEITTIDVTPRYDATVGGYVVDGIRAADLDSVMTITIDGNEGEFSLAYYINSNPSVELAKAMYVYAQVAEAYIED